MPAYLPQLRFVILFVAIYVVFHVTYLQIPIEYLINYAYRWGINEPAAYIINAIVNEEIVRVEGHRLISKAAILEIVRGCDGSGVFFIVAAAILAFRAPLRLKLAGMVTGLLLIYVLNQTRVIVLYFVVAHEPDWFTPLHTYYIPTFLIIVMCLFFIAWLDWVQKHDSQQLAA